MTTTKPPTERTLPDKQEILAQILTVPREAKAARRPGWLVPAIAAAAVAAIVGAILVVPQALRSGEPAVTPASRPVETEIDLDLGPLSQAEINQLISRQCIFMHGDASKKLLHAQKVRSGWGDGVDWTLIRVGDTAAGSMVGAGKNRLTGCVGRPGKSDQFGIDVRLHDFVSTVGPAPTEEELAKLPKGESFVHPRYDDSFQPREMIMLEARPGKKWATGLWVRVPSTVDRVRQRIVVNGKPQPQWFSSKTVDGLNYTQAWMDAPIRRTDRITFEVQFLDKSGQPVKIPGSTGLTTVVGCGGMQIGKVGKDSDYWVS